MKRFTKGQALSASQLNQIVDAVKANTPQSGNGNLISGNGSGGYTIESVEGTQAPLEGASDVPFRPFFTYSQGGISCSIVASHVITDGLNIIPTFQDEPIYDPDNAEHEPPSQDLDDDTYQMWLEYAGTGAKITVSTGEPFKVEGKKYYKLATFEILDAQLKTIFLHSETGLTLDSLLLPWVPVFFDEDGDTKFTITQGDVLDVMLGTYTTPALDVDYTPETDDKYYCKVTTDPNGSVTQAEVIKGDDPANTQHSAVDGVDGEYNYKLFEIKGTTEDGFYAVQHASQDIHWHTRDLVNIGGGTELVSAFNAAENSNEIKSLDVEPPQSETEYQEHSEIKIDLAIEDLGDVLKFSAVAKVPDDGNNASGVDLYLSFYKGITLHSQLEFRNGILVNATEGGISTDVIDLNVCCDTPFPV